MKLKRIMAVGFGGMAGALLRMLVYEVVPAGWGLWLVNGMGSLMIGFVAAYSYRKSAEFRLFVSTGLLGSFTTFSAFSHEWFRLLNTSFVSGLAFAVSMTISCVLAAFAGLLIGRKAVAE